jgi:hypothetical protein
MLHIRPPFVFNHFSSSLQILGKAIMNKTISTKKSGTPFVKILTAALIGCVPIVGLIIWWQPTSNSTTRDSIRTINQRIKEVQEYAKSSNLPNPGEQTNFPQVDEWVNYQGSPPQFGPGLTVLDFTTLW